MKYLRAIWAHTAGLFVDDVPFAAAILLWLAFVCALLPWAGVKRDWLAVPMLLGLMVILSASAVRRARRLARSPATKP